MGFDIGTVGLITKPGDKRAEHTIRQVIDWCKSRKIDVLHDEPTAMSLGLPKTECTTRAEIVGRADLIVVFGGDGTLLGVARLAEEREVPILGVNLGSLGFLTEVSQDEAIETLDAVFQQATGIEERMMLQLEMVTEGKSTLKRCALNDIVIRGQTARIVHIDLFVNNQSVASYHADGLIISTPTGSTAYSLSAGGPILFPTMEAFVISPICPHTLTQRPIVIPGDSEVEIRLPQGTEDLQATLDGQVEHSVTYRDVLRISRGRHKFKLVFLPRKNYFEVLRKKLRWGESVRQGN